MVKGRWKTFALGAVFGSLIAGGFGYASAEQFNIQALFPKVTYSVDGKKLNDEIVTMKVDDEYYVPLHSFAKAMNKEVIWKADGQLAELKTVEQVAYENVLLNEAPEQIQEWVERSLGIKLGQVYRDDGFTYVLVTRDMQPSGGYGIEIENIFCDEWGTWIHTKETNPKNEEFVTAEVTYPYALVRLTDESMKEQVYFINDQGERLPSLPEISYLHPFSAQSDNIIMFEPEITENGVTVHGIVRSFNDIAYYKIAGALNDNKQWINTEENEWTYFSESISKNNKAESVTVTTFASNGNRERVEVHLP